MQAWQTYFDRESNYPKKGEICALDKKDDPLAQHAFFMTHNRRIHKLGFTEGNDNEQTGYDVNLHEI